ncbi:MAG: hypothetical protein KKC19_00070 [Nanoarchaeota archaeon]|nr:hypothetical protein [Nanoarchaeota archaeon]
MAINPHEELLYDALIDQQIIPTLTELNLLENLLGKNKRIAPTDRHIILKKSRLIGRRIEVYRIDGESIEITEGFLGVRSKYYSSKRRVEEI